MDGGRLPRDRGPKPLIDEAVPGAQKECGQLGAGDVNQRGREPAGRTPPERANGGFRLSRTVADDLDHPLNADALVEGLDSSFRIAESCLERWTVDMLAEEIHRKFDDEVWVHTRGSVLQRVFSHDVYHCGELSQTLGMAGLPQIDLWD
ncbi:MAG TPA: hypothetical protein VEQ37_05730 [Actinomycetota bacterium]|nr:hypothetical protein [Actinomycetota bacterium]